MKVVALRASMVDVPYGRRWSMVHGQVHRFAIHLPLRGGRHASLTTAALGWMYLVVSAACGPFRVSGKSGQRSVWTSGSDSKAIISTY